MIFRNNGFATRLSVRRENRLRSAGRERRRESVRTWETLEERVVLSGISVPHGIVPAVTGQIPLTINGTDADDILTLSTAANHVTTINLNGNTTTATGQGTLTVALKGGQNTINVLSSFSDVTIVVVGGENNGVNVVNVGTANHDLRSAPFGPLVTQSVNSLVVDDSNDTVSRSIGFTTSSSTQNAINATGLPEIDYTPTSRVTYRAGSGGNTVNVAVGVTGTPGALNLFGGSGNDHVNVSVMNGAFTYVGVAGSDSIFFGMPATYGSTQGNSLNSISGPVMISNPSGTLALALDDSASTTAKGMVINSDGITGLFPQPMAMSQLSSLSITTSNAGGNSIAVQSTSVPTTINGTDNLHNDDQVSIGKSGSVQQITAPLTFTQTGYESVTIDDSADPTARTATLGDSAPGSAITAAAGLAPVTIAMPSASLRILTINLGTSTTSLTATTDPSSVDPTQVYQVVVNGQTTNDHNALILDYTAISNSSSGTNYVLNGNILNEGNNWKFTFNHLSSVPIKSGAGNDTYKILTADPSTSTIQLDGGGGINTFDLSDYTYNINVNLANHAMTPFHGASPISRPSWEEREPTPSPARRPDRPSSSPARTLSPSAVSRCSSSARSSAMPATIFSILETVPTSPGRSTERAEPTLSTTPGAPRTPMSAWIRFVRVVFPTSNR